MARARPRVRRVGGAPGRPAAPGSGAEGRRVSPDLRREIRQQRPFESVEQEAYLNLARTHAALSESLDAVLARNNVTQQQYNVLRILRGAGAEGVRCADVAERMVITPSCGLADAGERWARRAHQLARTVARNLG